MRVIFPDAGGICIVSPTGLIPVQEVARKDVPFGLPYLIVDDSAFPPEHEFRAAWQADFSEPDGYGIGPQRWFIEQAEKEITLIEGMEPTEDLSAIQERESRLKFNRNLIEQMKAEVLQIEVVQL